jgi:hypothetical protein
MGFFDDHPQFLGTGRTRASTHERLNLRHEAIIENNRHLIAGARVLDLASHDGRWAYAALQAGAKHVTAVEARPELVADARGHFTDMDPAFYTLVEADVFAALADPPEVDVVLCLGFMYHTLRWPELLTGIVRTGAETLVIDTVALTRSQPLVRISVETDDHPEKAVADAYSYDGRVLMGRPSLSALEVMVGVYGFDVDEVFDWPQLLATREGVGMSEYAQGGRVTVRCVRR